MKLVNAVGVRDALMMAAALKIVLPEIGSSAKKHEIVRNLKEAFAKSDNEWKEYLSEAIGEKNAKIVSDMMEHNF